MDPDDLRDLQNERLRWMVKHSDEHVPYYHQLFHHAHLDPAKIQCVEDLAKIPITAKADVRRTPLHQLRAQNIPDHECVVSETSGTSGIPLTIFKTKYSKLQTKVLKTMLQLDCGDSIFNKRTESIPWGLRLPAIFQRIGIFRTQYISPFETPHRQLEQIRDFHAHTHLALPSSALTLAKEMHSNPVADLRLERFFVQGELLDPLTQRMIEETFTLDVYDAYGLSETGRVATECREHVKHIQSDMILVEIVKDGEAVADGEEGEVVLTNLTNLAMPFIRYNTSDIGYRISADCACPCHYPAMRLTSGRKSDVILLPDDRVIPAHEATMILRGKMYALRQFQVVQENLNTLSVFLVKGKGFSPDLVTEIQQTFTHKFGPDFETYVSIVDAIPREKSGKFRSFKTLLPYT
jgi:phenylacetate-CoA ligase